MKGKLQFIRLLSFVAIVCCFISCKKNSNSSTQCRIIDIKSSDTSHSEIVLTYDSSKRLSTVTRLPEGRRDVFSYSDNLIIRNESTTSGTLLAIDTITLGANGLFSTFLRVSASKTVLQYDTANYNSGNQLTRFVITDHTFNSVASYTWRDGDMVAANFNGASYNYNYYDLPADKYISGMNDFLSYGTRVLNCKHLFKGVTGETITYKFDVEGKIIGISDSYLGSTTNFAYTYSCD